MGGKDEPSPEVVREGEGSFGGEPPDAKALSAGGLYLPVKPSACDSLALKARNDE